MIELSPVERAAVVKEATPPDRVAVPSEVGPFRNSTVPVGVPAPGLTGVIVAVKVTFWLATGEVGKKVTAVVVDATATGNDDRRRSAGCVIGIASVVRRDRVGAGREAGGAERGHSA